MQLKMNNRLFQNQQLPYFQKNKLFSKATVNGKNLKVKMNNGGGLNISIKSNSVKKTTGSKSSNTTKDYFTLKHEEACLAKACEIVEETATMILDKFDGPEDLESFKALTYTMASKLSKVALDKLKTEHEKIVTYNENGQSELAENAIHAFDSIIESKFTDRALDELDFQRFKKAITGEFKANDIQDLDKFRNQALSFEEKGEFRSADESWSKFDFIVEKYDGEYESMHTVEESDSEVELFNDEKSPLSINISWNLNKLKKQMALLKILSDDKGKNNSKINSVFQFDHKIDFLNKIKKNGLKTINQKNLIRFLDKAHKAINDVMDTVNVQKSKMQSTYKNSTHSFNEMTSIVDYYI